VGLTEKTFFLFFDVKCGFPAVSPAFTRTWLPDLFSLPAVHAFPFFLVEDPLLSLRVQVDRFNPCGLRLRILRSVSRFLTLPSLAHDQVPSPFDMVKKCFMSICTAWRAFFLFFGFFFFSSLAGPLPPKFPILFPPGTCIRFVLQPPCGSFFCSDTFFGPPFFLWMNFFPPLGRVTLKAVCLHCPFCNDIILWSFFSPPFYVLSEYFFFSFLRLSVFPFPSMAQACV